MIRSDRRPRYITFDCYGTLTRFQMDNAIVETLGPRLPAEIADAFLATCEAYRFDEVLGPYRPYRMVVSRALERTARRYGVECRAEDGARVYGAVPGWGPHPDVPDALIRLSHAAPLAILSNAADEQIHGNVGLLGAPIDVVVTAEQAQAYKPRLAAFEFLLDRLDCAPDEVIHVSSSPAYDLRPAADLGITQTVYLNRGYEPPQPWLGYHEVSALAQLADLLGV